MPYTKIDWTKARADWEAGLSCAKVAKLYGVSTGAVEGHRKKEAWVRQEPAGPEAVVAGFAPEQTVRKDEALSEAQRRIIELEARLSEAEREADRHRPTVNLPIYKTVAEVRRWVGEAKLADIAGLKLAQMNKDRMKYGLAPISYKDDPAAYEQEIDGILQELLDRRTRWVDPSSRLRTVKMARRRKDGSWFVFEVGVEQQLHNEAGQPGAAIWKQRDKGSKLMMPYLCQMHNCWSDAAVGADGKFLFAGYCSGEHMAFDPYLGREAQPGIAMTISAAGRAAG